jgi:trehalose 6-phosphate synthase/phosphatase
MSHRDARLVVVSNRLPITIERVGQQIRVRPSSGGLVAALLPAFKEKGGCWVGWPGTDYDPDIARILRGECAPEYCFEPVFMSDEEKRCFYDGWSNEIIWPLFHDLQSNCNFDPGYWAAYRDANEKFADIVEQAAGPKDFIWVHDYHLMMLADALRSRGMRSKMAYFHHIPFPAPDIFEKLPWRCEILRGLLQFTALGFQTERDSRNFVSCIRRCFSDAQIEDLGSKVLVHAEQQCVSVGIFPISVDYKSLSCDATVAEIGERTAVLRQGFQGKKIVLGLDRLDYTKGIPQRLAAFRELLRREPSLKGKVTLLQVVVPSREDIPQYQRLKDTIEKLVSEINGEYSAPDWTPVVYWHRSLPRPELLTLYRAADVAFITSLKDGMNLVAKEFCAARIDETGVLVLSEFAGAAAELKEGALLVNPYDTEGMSAALMRALWMPEREQRLRMRQMREVIEHADVYEWCKSIWRDVGFNGVRSYPQPNTTNVVSAAMAI